MRASSSSSFIDADAGSVTDGVDVPSSPPAVAAISVTVRHHRCISATPRGGTARHVTHLGDGPACVLLARLGPVCTPRTHADALIEPPTRTTVRPRMANATTTRKIETGLANAPTGGFERRPPRGEKIRADSARARGRSVTRRSCNTALRRPSHAGGGPSKRPRRARRSIASRRRAEREHIREVGLPQVRSSADPPTIFSLSCPRSSARPCTPAVCRAPTRPSRGEDDDYVFSVVFEQVRQCHVRSFETNLKR